MSPRILTAALLIALARTAAAAPADLATEFAAEAAVELAGHRDIVVRPGGLVDAHQRSAKHGAQGGE